MNEQTTVANHVSHVRERGARRGCAAWIFNGASVCVRLESKRSQQRRRN